MDDTSSSQSSLFSGINKYLILLLIIFVLFIAFQLFSYYSRPPIAQNLPTPSLIPTTIEPSAGTEKSSNEDFFDVMKSRLKEDNDHPVRATKRFEGTIVKIERFRDGDYRFALSIQDEKGKNLYLRYKNELTGKIRLLKNIESEETLLLDDFKVGDQVVIEETLDPEVQTYEASVISIKIAKK